MLEASNLFISDVNPEPPALVHSYLSKASRIALSACFEKSVGANILVGFSITATSFYLSLSF